MLAAMKDAMASGCGEHEHDWCEIPLHEDYCICAECGEVRETILVLSSWNDAPDCLLSGERLLMTLSI
jgi:hypothetical protein